MNLPTPYQEYIHLSRYARYRYEDNRRETWDETVDRFITFFRTHLQENNDHKLSAQVVSQVREAILNLKVMPSMRCLMTAGEALLRENVSGYNCSYITIDSLRSFDELLYLSVTAPSSVALSIDSLPSVLFTSKYF